MGEKLDDINLNLACLSMDLFYQLVEKIPFAVIITTPDPKIEYVNQKFEDLTGYQLDEIKGVNPNLLQSGLTAREEYQMMWKTINDGQEWQGQFCNQTKSGEKYWQKVRVFPLKDDNNQITHFVAIEDEAAKERELKEQLKEERKFLRKIIDTTPNIIFVKDWWGEYKLANQTIAEIYGTTTEELEGAKDIDFNNKIEEVDHFIQDDQQVMRSKEKKIIKEEELTTAKGKKRWFQTVKVPLNIEKPQEDRYVLGVATDITNRKKLEMLKEQLISNVSHEIRTPLGSVLGFVELLLTREFSKEKQKEYLELIHREASRLQNLINDFLDIERLESKEDNLSKESFRLKELVAEVFELYQIHAEHDFKINCAQDLKVKADYNKIKQVINNLVSNAIKYSPQGSQIIACCDQNDEEVIVKIKDQGVGIAKADQSDLFNEFYRASNSNNYQGTGLGLAISKKIIEQHDGEIGVESKLGEGSSFYFTLPKLLTGR